MRCAETFGLPHDCFGFAIHASMRGPVLHCAETFAGNPAILGYDIINEPMGSERRQIMPLFEDAAKVIRARDKDAIIFLTPMFLLGLVCPSCNYVIILYII